MINILFMYVTEQALLYILIFVITYKYKSLKINYQKTNKSTVNIFKMNQFSKGK